jgi:hypothetical protein
MTEHAGRMAKAATRRYRSRGTPCHCAGILLTPQCSVWGFGVDDWLQLRFSRIRITMSAGSLVVVGSFHDG